jgi:hypothetical protein
MDLSVSPSRDSPPPKDCHALRQLWNSKGNPSWALNSEDVSFSPFRQLPIEEDSRGISKAIVVEPQQPNLHQMDHHQILKGHNHTQEDIGIIVINPSASIMNHEILDSRPENVIQSEAFPSTGCHDSPSKAILISTACIENQPQNCSSVQQVQFTMEMENGQPLNQSSPKHVVTESQFRETTY